MLPRAQSERDQLLTTAASWLLKVAAMIFCFSPLAVAELEPLIPKICTGERNFNGLKDWSQKVAKCPENHVVLGTGAGGVRGAPGEKISVHPVCCPLPASDILQEQHLEEPEECPENYIATGGENGTPLKEDPSQLCEECEKVIICTKINTKRYQLGPKTEGAYWGDGNMFWRNKMKFLKGDIPAAIRFAFGRDDRTKWDPSGCIGYPFGSVLVAKYGKRCHQREFQQLQFSGLEGDPAKGTPVPMFAECARVRSVFSDNPICENVFRGEN